MKLSITAAILLMASSAMVAEDRVKLSILTRFDREPKAAVIQAMQQEVSVLFQETGADIRWYPQASDNFLGNTNDVLVVHVRGACELDPLRTAGNCILASVLRVDGLMQPFIKVDCAATVAHVRAGFSEESHYRNAERIFGRALGRVLAHELYHYLTQTADHHHSEIFSRSLRPRGLVAEKASFDEREIRLLRSAVLALSAPHRASVGP